MTNAPHSAILPIRKIKIAPLDANRSARRFPVPFWLALAHIPLGMALYSAGTAGVLHPLLIFFFGLRRAYDRRYNLADVAPFVAYLVGAEILWRMAKLPIYWESGKYGAAALMLIALVRRGRWAIPKLPLLYLLFLLPSCLVTLFGNDWTVARNMLSFNMSGPLLLFAACWFFSGVKVSWTQAKIILAALLLPLASVAATTLFYTATTADIQFNTESNHQTSGGFGPNQVSAMLGLGAFLAASIYLLFANCLAETLSLGVLIVFFFAQSVMTFSRGGTYNAVGAIVAVAALQMANPAQIVKRLLPAAGLTAIFLLLIFPYLNDFTGGNLQARFEETDPTNRGSIVEADLRIFAENPIFGVGVGASFREYEKLLDQGTASHTEFSRTIAEHGFFGVCALATLAAMFVRNIMRGKSSAGRALTAGFIVWSSLFMLNAGMRLAAPAFILGLSWMTISDRQTRGRKKIFDRRRRNPPLKMK